MKARSGLMMSIQEARRIGERLKPSRAWEAMVLTNDVAETPQGERGEVWMNNLYCANVWRRAEGVCIGIFSLDGEPRHDWRDFQRIKNDILGEEAEAVELYPAESRLIDTSNYYYLFSTAAVSEIGKKIGRQILHPEHSIAPQRGWANGQKPAEVLARRDGVAKGEGNLL